LGILLTLHESIDLIPVAQWVVEIHIAHPHLFGALDLFFPFIAPPHLNEIAELGVEGSSLRIEILEFLDHSTAYFPNAILFILVPHFICLSVLGSQFANGDLEFT